MPNPYGIILPYRGVYPSVDHSAFIAPNAVLAGDVAVGGDSSVWFGCVLRGDINRIRIGTRTNIQDGSVLHVSSTDQGTVIGDDVTVGHMALLHNCILCDNCFVGMRSTVMDGVIVESSAVIAAGSLITEGKRVLQGQLWAGSPARFWRNLTKQELSNFSLFAKRYVEVARAYRTKQDSQQVKG